MHHSQYPCSSYLCNSQAKLCPASLFCKPLKAPPTCSPSASAGVPGPSPDTRLLRCLVFSSSAPTQKLLGQPHSLWPSYPPFWASGCLRTEPSLEWAGSPLESCLLPSTSSLCCLILAELSLQGLSFSTWKAALCQRSRMLHNVGPFPPRHQTGSISHHQSGDWIRLARGL